MIHRVGIGTDVHRLVPGRVLVLGNVVIEHDAGAAGHSDGDVVLHAIIDAIAGAAGLPDVGQMFPDTDPQYRDADSGGLLTRAMQRVADRGYGVVNLDVTIHAERPKLAPYKARMCERIARLVGVAPDAVNVKAKTNEGVDAVGRGEAIACTAVAGLERTSVERPSRSKTTGGRQPNGEQ